MEISIAWADNSNDVSHMSISYTHSLKRHKVNTEHEHEHKVN